MKLRNDHLNFVWQTQWGMKVNYIQALGGTFMLANKLFKRSQRGVSEMVGVLLPSSCIAASINGACFMSGKIPVNLNFTASQESLDAAIKQCEMTKIVTSRKFSRKVGLETR